LQTIYECSKGVGYQENEVDGCAVGELAEDLRDTIVEYQVGPSF